MSNLEKIILAILMVVSSIIVRVCVFLKMYIWFVQDVFRLPKINYLEALGVFIFAAFLKSSVGGIIKGIEDYFNDFIESLIVSLLFLVFGYIIFKLL